MDAQTEITTREALESQKDWLRKTSWWYFRGYGAGDDANRQDLCQEGYLGMWEAIRNFDGTGTLEGWMRQNARWKMNVWMTRFTRHPEPAVDMEDPVWSDLIASGELDSVFTAYHHGEIMEAINSLSETQKEYVYRRFWLGQIQPEISKAMNVVNAGTSYWTARYGARTKLAEKLAHLVEV